MASYKKAVQWIAENDSDGDDDRLDSETVSGYVTSLLIADLFNKDSHQVGYDVIKFRKKNDKLKGKNEKNSN